MFKQRLFLNLLHLLLSMQFKWEWVIISLEYKEKFLKFLKPNKEKECHLVKRVPDTCLSNQSYQLELHKL